MSFSVTGITLPSDLSGDVWGYLVDSEMAISTVGEMSTTGCLNFNHKVTEALPNLLVQLKQADDQEIDFNDFEIVNGTSGGSSGPSADGWCSFYVIPTDPSAPVYCKYQDCIVFVGNY